MVQWEYHIEQGSLSITEDTADLNALGREGWELVAVCWVPPHHDAWYWFKRPVPEPSDA